MGLKNVSIRLADEDLDRLDALAKRFGDVASPSALARAALRLGLARLEAEGFQAIEALTAKPARKGVRK